MPNINIFLISSLVNAKRSVEFNRTVFAKHQAQEHQLCSTHHPTLTHPSQSLQVSMPAECTPGVTSTHDRPLKHSGECRRKPTSDKRRTGPDGVGQHPPDAPSTTLLSGGPGHVLTDCTMISTISSDNHSSRPNYNHKSISKHSLDKNESSQLAYFRNDWNSSMTLIFCDFSFVWRGLSGLD